jgi:hypothetical protein
MATYRHVADPLEPFDLSDSWGIRWQLRDGCPSDPPPGAPEPELTDEILRLAWARLRDELIDEIRSMDPGSRPEAFWLYDFEGTDPLDGAARLRALLDTGELGEEELAAVVDQAGRCAGPAEDGATYSEAFLRRARARAAIVAEHLTNGSPIGDRTNGKDASE